MTIDTNSIGSGQNQSIGITSKQKDAPSKGQQVDSGSPSPADRVTLTNDAEQLRRLDEAVSGTSGVDAQKVATIKTAIAEGKFEVDADKIATKLLELEQQLDR
jgi:negative regulator of flagellin synthesis FlgM